MLVYQSFGQFKKQTYKVYTTAEHLAGYREDLPTRRRQLNAINRDIENMREAIATITNQQNAGNTWSNYLGDKYGALDLLDMREDLQNLEEARAIILEDPCPKKIEKQNAAMSAAHDAAQASDAAVTAALEKLEATCSEIEAAQEEPQTLTIELPAGVTPFDIANIFRAGKEHAHAQRMKAISNNPSAADVWTHIYNAACDIQADQLHALSWDEPNALKEYQQKNCVINL